MIDHVSFSVNDYTQSLTFYDNTLKIIGMERLMNFDTPQYQVAAYGANNKPCFWISIETNPKQDESVGKARGFHVAFRAPTVESINDWYQKCLELGGTDNGAPGPRPHYRSGFYGAFIIDPNGWRIEAALHHYKP